MNSETRKCNIKIKYVCPSNECNFATSSGRKEEILVHLYRKHNVRFLQRMAKPCCLVNGDETYLRHAETDLYIELPLTAPVEPEDWEKVQELQYERKLKLKRELLGLVSNQFYNGLPR